MKIKNRIALPWLVAFSLLGAMLLFVMTVQAAASLTFQDEIPYPDTVEARQAAVVWLVESHQNEDGGYSSFSGGADLAPSDAGGTIDALFALAAGEADLSGPLSYLLNNKDQLISYASLDGSTAGKTVLALAAAGEDPRDFDGEDYVIAITNQISPTGQFNVNTAFNQSLAILGLAVAAELVPDNSLAWLVEQQEKEGEFAGSWDDGFGTAGNADSTAIAIAALLAAGLPVDDETVAAAISFIAGSQLESGGWEYGPGFGENANSTALTVNALNLVGEDVTSASSPWLQEGRTPVVALLSWQSESGAFQADFGEGRFDDFFSTVQSAPALAGINQVIPTPTAESTATDEPTTEPTKTPTEEPATQPPPTEEPTSEPTSTVLPTSTVEPATPVIVEEEPESTGPAVAGGDSILPFLMVGAVVIIIIGFAVWYFRDRQARGN